MEIDIATLIRTGNVVHNRKPAFSEYIVAAVNNSLSNDLPHSEAYFLVLEEMRPDIADKLYYSAFDPFSAKKNEHNLTNFVAEVYKLW